MKLQFAKYSGNGNDFIILDHPQVYPSAEDIQRMCHRRFGIGADGVLILESSDKADGYMRIYNADGGEAEMCGNGLRCLASFLDKKVSHKKDFYKIQTMNGLYSIYKKEQDIAVEMSERRDEDRFDLTHFNKFDKKFFVNTGVPHLLFLTQDVKELDIAKIAPQYRFDPLFSNGSNVSWIEVENAAEKQAYVRTYERGVEAETYSCGTGLSAAALALNSWYGWDGVITLHTLGGTQKVEIGDKLLYWGEVIHCFSGVVEL